MTNEFLNSFDYVLTDCDGVLWIGQDAIPGSPETINALKRLGKKVFYVTNNSTRGREEYLKKCLSLGFNAELDDIFPTSYCVAIYLKYLNFKKKVYVFGSTGITSELDKVGIEYLPIGPDPVPEDYIKWLKELKLDPEVGAVVVGFDEHVSYPKLTKAASYLKNPDCIFIATNRDEKFPSESDLIIPGTGTLVAAVQTVSGRQPISLGKPSKFMLDCIKQKHPELDLTRSIMIGDKLSTDILLGTGNGLRTLLVLTGISNMEEVEKYQESNSEEDHLLIPDYYLNCLGELGNLLQV